MTNIKTATEAAQTVLDQAMHASAQGTFAVGGCIVDNKTGEVVHAIPNNVLRPLPGDGKLFTYDPTAHGERQLVYWYYANKDALKLPEPKDLTVVTTLDPCAMCTGTLMTAGFNVAVVAIDDFAGINYDSSFEFNTLPAKLRKQAIGTFGYYATGDAKQDPKKYVRNYKGGLNVAFKDTTASAQSLVGCLDIFSATMDTVRDQSSDSGSLPKDLTDPSALPEDSVIYQTYRNAQTVIGQETIPYPDAFKYQVADTRLPDDKVLLLLEKMASDHSNSNAVAFLDPFGNVIQACADRFDISPVHTAFMNVTRSYAMARYQLMADPKTRADAEKYLTHPKYGTFVFLNAPDPDDTTTIMGLGAYGSTMEGPVPQTFPCNLQYFFPPVKGTIEELSQAIMQLPPFYTTSAKVGIARCACNVK